MGDPLLKKGLPANLEAEQFVLGSILLDDSVYPVVAASLDATDFVLIKHQRILSRMGDLQGRGEKIDYMTLANELMKQGQLEAVGGVAYLSALTEGLPHVQNIDSYIRIVKEKAARRRLIHAAERLTQEALNGPDLDEALSGAETLLREINEGWADTQEFRQPGQIVEARGVDDFLSPHKRPGLGFPWGKLTQETTGLHPGDLCLLAARPSVGKTAAALQIAYHVAAKVGRGVVFFSLEMSQESLVRRLICMVAGVDQHRFRSGDLSESERRAIAGATGQIAHIPLFLNDRTGSTVTAVHAAVRRLRAKQDVGLVVIDYIGLMTARKAENRNAEVSAISRTLKGMARDLSVPMLVLSQLSRAPETRGGEHPRLSDLRDSGSLEQDADLVFFIYRPEVHKPRDESLRGLADWIIAKQRNGPTGMIDMTFLREFGRFELRA